MKRQERLGEAGDCISALRCTRSHPQIWWQNKHTLVTLSVGASARRFPARENRACSHARARRGQLGSGRRVQDGLG